MMSESETRTEAPPLVFRLESFCAGPAPGLNHKLSVLQQPEKSRALEAEAGDGNTCHAPTARSCGRRSRRRRSHAGQGMPRDHNEHEQPNAPQITNPTVNPKACESRPMRSGPSMSPNSL